MERLLLFTDAVFAIIVTLLALEIRVPDGAALGSTQEVFETLSSMVPKFGAYALSFGVIAMVWNVHLRRYRYVIAVNSKVVTGNLLQLMVLGLVPFTTSMIAAHVNALTVSLYAAVMLLNVVIAWVTWLIASGNPSLVSSELTPKLKLEGNWRSGVAAGVFALSIGIAWWSPVAAMLSWALQIPANIIIGKAGLREP
jgi:uncharacterized membrane protein